MHKDGDSKQFIKIWGYVVSVITKLNKPLTVSFVLISSLIIMMATLGAFSLFQINNLQVSAQTQCPDGSQLNSSGNCPTQPSGCEGTSSSFSCYTPFPFHPQPDCNKDSTAAGCPQNPIQQPLGSVINRGQEVIKRTFGDAGGSINPQLPLGPIIIAGIAIPVIAIAVSKSRRRHHDIQSPVVVSGKKEIPDNSEGVVRIKVEGGLE
jgi:hypothetical protein